MLRLKGCPKCMGDVRTDRDEYGWYEECLQCGYLRDLVEVRRHTAQHYKNELSRQRKRARR